MAVGGNHMAGVRAPGGDEGDRRNADDQLQARIVGSDGVDKPLDGLDVLFNGERPMAQI